MHFVWSETSREEGRSESREVTCERERVQELLGSLTLSLINGMSVRPRWSTRRKDPKHTHKHAGQVPGHMLKLFVLHSSYLCSSKTEACQGVQVLLLAVSGDLHTHYVQIEKSINTSDTWNIQSKICKKYQKPRRLLDLPALVGSSAKRRELSLPGRRNIGQRMPVW